MAESLLGDLTVVDLSENLPGPFLTQSFVDLGARVIKIERPGGESARTSSPGLFKAVNRGKEFLQLDLKHQAGRHVMSDLLRDADVLVDGFRPGVLERLGLDPVTLSRTYPRLVIVSIIGYHLESSQAMEPGHDITYAAHSGLLSVAGPDNVTPSWTPGIPLGDLAASSAALASTLAAVHARERTGRGCRVVVPIADAMSHLLNPRLGVYHEDGLTDVEAMRKVPRSLPAYGAFPCRDGQLLVLAALENHFWESLVRELGLLATVGDRWTSYAERRRDHDEINRMVGAAVAKQELDDLLPQLRRADVPCAPVASPFEALDVSNAARDVDPDEKYFGFPASFTYYAG